MAGIEGLEDSECQETVDECGERLDVQVAGPLQHRAAAHARALVLNCMTLHGGVLYAAQIVELEGWHGGTPPVALIRSFVRSKAGLPVFMIHPPGGVPNGWMARLTLFILRDTAHAAALLQQRQAAVLMQMRGVSHVPDPRELSRQLRRLGRGAGARLSGNFPAIYTCAFGADIAARAQHRRMSAVAASAGASRVAADDEDRRRAAHLLAACIAAGVVDPMRAPPVVKARAVAQYKYEVQQESAVTVDSLEHTNPILAAAIRDGQRLLLESGHARDSPNREAVIGTGSNKVYIPRIDLTLSFPALYLLYQQGAGVLTFYRWRRYCVLPQMEPADEQTCLCPYCEALRLTLLSLETLLKAKELIAFLESASDGPAADPAADPAAAAAPGEAANIAYATLPAPFPLMPQLPGASAAAAAPSYHAPQPSGALAAALSEKRDASEQRLDLLKEVHALPALLHKRRLDIMNCVADDPITSFTAMGDLEMSDSPASPLGDLCDRIAALVLVHRAEHDDDDALLEWVGQNEALAEWVEDVLLAGADIQARLQHLRRWAWQGARYQQMEQLVVAGGQQGVWRVIIIHDFKKIACTHWFRQVQSDYWKNHTLSVYGAVVLYWANGALQRRSFAYVSDDTVQDSDWIISVLPRLAQDVAAVVDKQVIHEAVLVADNAYHFKNGMLYTGPLLDFRKALNARQFTSFFWEQGEGKAEADRFFGAIGNELKQETRATGKVEVVAELVAIVNKLDKAKAAELVVTRRDSVETSYTIEGVKQFKQLWVREDYDEWHKGRPPAEVREGAWLARPLAGLGPPIAFNRVVVQTRPVRLSVEEQKVLLCQALARTNGVDRANVLSALLTTTPLLKKSDCFRFGSDLPHTVALAIIQLEHGRTLPRSHRRLRRQKRRRPCPASRPRCRHPP